MFRRLCMIIILSLLFMQVSANADIIYVGDDKEYNSITEAFSAADNGDEIIISGGIYDESRESFPIESDKSIYIHAADGANVLIKSPLTLITMKLKGAGSRIESLSFEFIRSSGIHILADNIVVDNCHFELGDTEWRETSCGMWIAALRWRI